MCCRNFENPNMLKYPQKYSETTIFPQILYMIYINDYLYNRIYTMKFIKITLTMNKYEKYGNINEEDSHSLYKNGKT